MGTTLGKVRAHVSDNQHIYSHPANITTLVMWGIALSSHANKEKSSLFG